MVTYKQIKTDGELYTTKKTNENFLLTDSKGNQVFFGFSDENGNFTNKLSEYFGNTKGFSFESSDNKNAHAHCNWNNNEDTAAPIYVYITKQTGYFDNLYAFKFNNTTMFTVHYYNKNTGGGSTTTPTTKTYTLNCIYVNNISNPLYAFLVNDNLSGQFTLTANPLHNTCDNETSFVLCMDTTESLIYNFASGANVYTLKQKYNYVSSSSYNGRIFFWNHADISRYNGGNSFSTVTLKLSDSFKLYKKSVSGYTFTIQSNKVYSFSKPDFTATITVTS